MTRTQRDVQANITHSLHTQAALLQKLLLPTLTAATRITIDELNNITGDVESRITLIDSRGIVLADNRDDPNLMDNHSARPEVAEARRLGEGASERFSETINQNMLYVAVRVDADERVLGFVRVAFPLKVVEEARVEVRNQTLLSGAVIAGFCLLAAFILARKFTRPVSAMTAGAAQIAKGHYDLRLPENRQDELGRLAIVLNELARETQERIEALTSSRNQLAAILSGLTEGVIAVDPGQRILHINERAREMLGVTRREPLKRSLSEVVKVIEISQAVDTCFAERSTVNTPVKFGGKTLDLTVVLLPGLDGTAVAGAIVILQDITEIRRLEQVRNDFVANASHELKTPISAIRGFAETIIDDPQMPADVMERFMERIRSQATRLDNIVQDLIHLSRFDSHVRTTSMHRIDLTAVLRKVYQLKAEDANDAAVQLTLDIGDQPLIAEGETEALEQMVSNLVDNAIKYTHAGGEVTLRLRVMDATAVIEVEDSGIGIPVEEQQRIFERFYRVDRARSREKGGTGLGLAIVKHIAQSHKGRVTVTSKVNQGSTFKVEIPLAS
ncbi:MAG: ATP-binding protein [Pseudomonadales bacterium]